MNDAWVPHKITKKTSLVSELSWYIAYLRLWGAYPVSVKDDSIEPSTVLRIFNIFASVALISFTCCAQYNSTDDGVLAVVVETVSYFSLFGTVCTWLSLATNTGVLCQIFQTLHSSDLLMSSHRVCPNLRWHGPAAWVWMALFHGTMALVLVLEIFIPLWSLTGMYRWIMNQAYFTLLFINMSNFMFLLLIAAHRFTVINNKLKALTADAQRQKSLLTFTSELSSLGNVNFKKVITGESTMHTLHQTCSGLQKCHLMVSEACNDLMSIYSLPCAMALMHATCELCCNIYKTFALPLVHSISLTFPIVFNSGKWAALSIIRFLAIVAPASYVTLKANGTFNLIFHLQAQVVDPHIKRQLESFSLQLSHPLEFRPLTLFSLDMNLFLSMLGCVATYVVILLQLHAAAPDIPPYV